jgi:hypothetical protein
MAKQNYTQVLKDLKFETRGGKPSKWAVNPEGKRLTPLETDLVKYYADKEKDKRVQKLKKSQAKRINDQ